MKRLLVHWEVNALARIRLADRKCSRSDKEISDRIPTVGILNFQIQIHTCKKAARSTKPHNDKNCSQSENIVDKDIIDGMLREIVHL